jgi:hypothetical protein
MTSSAGLMPADRPRAAPFAPRTLGHDLYPRGPRGKGTRRSARSGIEARAPGASPGELDRYPHARRRAARWGQPSGAAQSPQRSSRCATITSPWAPAINAWRRSISSSSNSKMCPQVRQIK